MNNLLPPWARNVIASHYRAAALLHRMQTVRLRRVIEAASPQRRLMKLFLLINSQRICVNTVWRRGELSEDVLRKMTEGFSVPVTCYECGYPYCGRSRRKGFRDEVARSLGWYPWRCGGCGTRFYLRRQLHTANAAIGAPEKLNAEGQGDVKDDAINDIALNDEDRDSR